MTLEELFDRLREVSEGTEAYLVGGCVRDNLIGRPFFDVDVAARGARHTAERLGGTLVSLGERFGTWRVVIPPWTVDVSELQGAITEDITRRDFTINAIAQTLGPDHGLMDPLGGVADLEAGIIRMVSPENLSVDPIRLLRAVRLAAELGFSLASDTEQAIAQRAASLSCTAPERQRVELVRILAADRAAQSLALMDRLGLLAVLLPELVAGKGVGQPKEHYWDVFEHQVQTVAAVETVLRGELVPEGYFDEPIGELTRGTLLKLTGLLHDVGKPATKSVQPDGRVRFFGHSQRGAEMVARAMVRLRFSDQHSRMVTTMVTHHLRPGQWSNGGLPTNRALYRYFRDLGDVAIDTIFLNLADHLAARGPAMDPEDWRGHLVLSGYALDRYFLHSQKAKEPRLVTGNDLMSEFALSPGPDIGTLLAEIDEAWKIGEIATKEEALALVRGRLVP